MPWLLLTLACSGPPAPAPYVVELPVNVTPMPERPGNPMTVAGVSLGRHLFYDPILSGPNTMACAACHEQRLAFTDGRPLSIGVHGKPTRRNAMPLFNLGWDEHFFWDKRAPSLEAQVLEPIRSDRELDQDLDALVLELEAVPAYRELFEAAFPREPISKDAIAKALAQFVRSLVSFDSKSDRILRGEGELTPLESRGNDLFSMSLPEHDPKSGRDVCDGCHHHNRGLVPDAFGFGLFTDPEPKSNGLRLADEDLGVAEVDGDAEHAGLFSVPSVRNLEVTAPYMHDGRFTTLAEVLTHYNTDVQPGPSLSAILQHEGEPLRLQLTDEDITAMVTYMKTFTDHAFLENPAHGSPFEGEPGL